MGGRPADREADDRRDTDGRRRLDDDDKRRRRSATWLTDRSAPDNTDLTLSWLYNPRGLGGQDRALTAAVSRRSDMDYLEMISTVHSSHGSTELLLYRESITDWRRRQRQAAEWRPVNANYRVEPINWQLS